MQLSILSQLSSDSQFDLLQQIDEKVEDVTSSENSDNSLIFSQILEQTTLYDEILSAQSEQDTNFDDVNLEEKKISQQLSDPNQGFEDEILLQADTLEQFQEQRNIDLTSTEKNTLDKNFFEIKNVYEFYSSNSNEVGQDTVYGDHQSIFDELNFISSQEDIELHEYKEKEFEFELEDISDFDEELLDENLKKASVLYYFCDLNEVSYTLKDSDLGEQNLNRTDLKILETPASFHEKAARVLSDSDKEESSLLSKLNLIEEKISLDKTQGPRLKNSQQEIDLTHEEKNLDQIKMKDKDNLFDLDDLKALDLKSSHKEKGSRTHSSDLSKEELASKKNKDLSQKYADLEKSTSKDMALDQKSTAEIQTISEKNYNRRQSLELALDDSIKIDDMEEEKNIFNLDLSESEKNLDFSLKQKIKDYQGTNLSLSQAHELSSSQLSSFATGFESSLISQTQNQFQTSTTQTHIGQLQLSPAQIQRFENSIPDLVKFSLSQQGRKAHLILNPKELGEVSIDIENLKNGQYKVKIVTQNEESHELFTKNQHLLEQSFFEQGGEGTQFTFEFQQKEKHEQEGFTQNSSQETLKKEIQSPDKAENVKEVHTLLSLKI